MKQLLIDTNIVLDLLARRDPFYEGAAQIFSLADRKQVNLSVSALTIANINYILTRLKNERDAREIVRRFRAIVEVLPLSAKTIDLALNDLLFSDFEDGLQYYTAIGNNIDIIITRNLKDFRSSKIPVMTATEYLGSVSL